MNYVRILVESFGWIKGFMKQETIILAKYLTLFCLNQFVFSSPWLYIPFFQYENQSNHFEESNIQFGILWCVETGSKNMWHNPIWVWKWKFFYCTLCLVAHLESLCPASGLSLFEIQHTKSFQLSLRLRYTSSPLGSRFGNCSKEVPPLCVS